MTLPAHAQLLAAAQTPGLDAAVDSTSRTIERGGLYAIISLLLLGMLGIFALRERDKVKHAATLEGLHDAQKLLSERHFLMINAMVEKQTVVLTENRVTNERIEELLVRTEQLLLRERA